MRGYFRKVNTALGMVTRNKIKQVAYDDNLNQNGFNLTFKGGHPKNYNKYRNSPQEKFVPQSLIYKCYKHRFLLLISNYCGVISYKSNLKSLLLKKSYRLSCK